MSSRGRLRRRRGLHVGRGSSLTSLDVQLQVSPLIIARNDDRTDNKSDRFGKSRFGSNGDNNNDGSKTRLSSDSQDSGGEGGGSNNSNGRNFGFGSNSDSDPQSSSNDRPSSFGGGSGQGSNNNDGGNAKKSNSDQSPTDNPPATVTDASSSISTVPSTEPSESTTSDSSQTTNKPPPCFSCIADNDARVRYSGPWTLNSDGFATTHSTTIPGSSLSLVFNGTGIVVFGTVPQSNSTHPPPGASYTIDADPPFTTNEPLAAQSIRFQPLFKVSSLSWKEHSIIINVTSATTPYTIESFFVLPGFSAAGLVDPKSTSMSGTPSGTPTSGTPSAPSPDPPSTSPPSSQKTAQVVAGVLGGAIFITLLVIAILFVRRRRRRSQGIASGTPWFSKYTRNFTRAYSPSEPTIFTSTESIMQYMPSSLWSTHTRSELQSVDFSVRYPQTPPPLPPKPRSRLSLPTLGNDLRRST